MLSGDDILFMKEAREEIRTNRTKVIGLVFKVTTEKDPVTGESIEKDVIVEVNAVVTVISTDRVIRKYIELGVEYKTGDIIVDVSREDFPEDFFYEDLHAIQYLGESYIDLAPVYLGMGDYNRYEFLGRREV